LEYFIIKLQKWFTVVFMIHGRIVGIWLRDMLIGEPPVSGEWRKLYVCAKGRNDGVLR
jgi:hypothetical protein